MFPVRLLIDTPSGLVALGPENERTPLPTDPSFTGPRLTYGPYLRAVADFLMKDSNERLHRLISECAYPAGSTSPVHEVHIVTEKHGALYHVCRLAIRFADKTCSFAVNTALLPEQLAFLEVEFALLQSLSQRFGLPYLPRPFLSGNAEYREDTGRVIPLGLFVAEWFEGYCEFHLSLAGSPESSAEIPRIAVWKHSGEHSTLETRTAVTLHRQAARILTAYFDEDTFEQVYPWHHAAGDFVVLDPSGSLDVKMITARDYRALFPQSSGTQEKSIAALHFFINMTIRMRLDRLDGTGDLAWAGPWSVDGSTAGFSEAWAVKESRDPELPSAGDLFSLFLQLSPDERLSFAELVMEQGLIETEEREYLERRLEAHISELTAAIEKTLR